MQLSFKKPHENKLINHGKPRPLNQINVVMFENGLLGLLGCGRQESEKVRKKEKKYDHYHYSRNNLLKDFFLILLFNLFWSN